MPETHATPTSLRSTTRRQLLEILAPRRLRILVIAVTILASQLKDFGGLTLAVVGGAVTFSIVRRSMQPEPSALPPSVEVAPKP